MSHVANFILIWAKAVAGAFGSEPRIIVDDSSIEIEFVRPKDRETYFWENLYNKGAIYYRGYANPVKIPEPDTAKMPDVDIITTDKYKSFMQQDVIADALDTQGGEMPWLLILQGLTVCAVLLLTLVQLGA